MFSILSVSEVQKKTPGKRGRKPGPKSSKVVPDAQSEPSTSMADKPNKAGNKQTVCKDSVYNAAKSFKPHSGSHAGLRYLS
jgi:hypothetical protein